jgi:hypothetical protein
MKARALGRFIGEFIEGLSGGKEPEEKSESPIVVPEEMVRRAVADFLRPMVEQAAAQEDVMPQQLDMMFDDARPIPHDDIAEMTLRRVEQMREADAERERQARMGEQVPSMFDPNEPGPKPWMGANLHPETIERNTA